VRTVFEDLGLTYRIVVESMKKYYVGSNFERRELVEKRSQGRK